MPKAAMSIKAATAPRLSEDESIFETTLSFDSAPGLPIAPGLLVAGLKLLELTTLKAL
jgi:hypothetical protein